MSWFWIRPPYLDVVSFVFWCLDLSSPPWCCLLCVLVSSPLTFYLVKTLFLCHVYEYVAQWLEPITLAIYAILILFWGKVGYESYMFPKIVFSSNGYQWSCFLVHSALIVPLDYLCIWWYWQLSDFNLAHFGYIRYSECVVKKIYESYWSSFLDIF